MEPSRILIADRDANSRALLRGALEATGCEVTEADNRELTLELVRSRRYQIILLDSSIDVMGLPETCRNLCATSTAAVIVIGTADDEKNVIGALAAGADGRLARPFSVPELLTRVRGFIQHGMESGSIGPHRVRLADRVIDFKARLVETTKNRVFRLTPKEHWLLRYLISHPNETLSHRTILQAEGEVYRKSDIKCLRVFVKQLRQKIEPDPRKPRYILTEPWVGYRYRPDKNSE